MYPCFQGYMRFVSLLFPLIRPRKVIHTHMYQLGLDDIGIYCHDTYFIAKSITVLLYTYYDIFLISFSAEGQLCNRVHYSSDTL